MTVSKKDLDWFKDQGRETAGWRAGTQHTQTGGPEKEPNPDNQKEELENGHLHQVSTVR